jgi:hypothetical protein
MPAGKRGNRGRVKTQPWGYDGWPDDWRSARESGRSEKVRHRSPRPGGRTGPVIQRRDRRR